MTLKETCLKLDWKPSLQLSKRRRTTLLAHLSAHGYRDCFWLQSYRTFQHVRVPLAHVLRKCNQKTELQYFIGLQDELVDELDTIETERDELKAEVDRLQRELTLAQSSVSNGVTQSADANTPKNPDPKSNSSLGVDWGVISGLTSFSLGSSKAETK